MTTQPQSALTLRKIYAVWLPLASTWLMMALEGPFLAAMIARLAEPKFNLAAYGVAFSFALIVEAPIIMIMSASTALVKGKQSFLKLRNFTYALNAAITFLMVIVLLPPVFAVIVDDLVGLPNSISSLTYLATAMLLPWPAAIGFRRFYQGILIRNGLSRRVAYGTVVRLAAMAATALVSAYVLKLPGVAVGAAALSIGVVAEAIASRVMVAPNIRRLLAEEAGTREGAELSYRGIIQFYYPLALTSMLGLGVHPIITFVIGQSRHAIESLAVLPVVNSLVFIFRSSGMAFQEVAIALLGDELENYQPIKKFAWIAGGIPVVLLALVAYTPLSTWWFSDVSGLTPELASFAQLPVEIMALLPGLTLLLSFQRALLVNVRYTSPITWATIIEVGGIVIVLVLAIGVFDMIGAVATALAFIIGRLAANGYLFVPYFRVLKR